MNDSHSKPSSSSSSSSSSSEGGFDFEAYLQNLSIKDDFILAADEESNALIKKKVEGYLSGVAFRTQYRLVLDPPPKPAFVIRLFPGRDKKKSMDPHEFKEEVLKMLPEEMKPDHIFFVPQRSTLNLYYSSMEPNNIKSSGAYKAYCLCKQRKGNLATIANCKIAVKKKGIKNGKRVIFKGFPETIPPEMILRIIAQDLRIDLTSLVKSIKIVPVGRGLVEARATFSAVPPILAHMNYLGAYVFPANDYYQLSFEIEEDEEDKCALCGGHHTIEECELSKLLPKWKPIRDKESDMFKTLVKKLDLGEGTTVSTEKKERSKYWADPGQEDLPEKPHNEVCPSSEDPLSDKGKDEEKEEDVVITDDIIAHEESYLERAQKGSERYPKKQPQTATKEPNAAQKPVPNASTATDPRKKGGGPNPGRQKSQRKAGTRS